MNAEAAEALIALREVYTEIFPHANMENVRFEDTQIAQVVLFRREMAELEKRMKWRTTRTADPE